MLQKKTKQTLFAGHSSSIDPDISDETVAVAAREILVRLLASYDGPVAVRLWNGERIYGEANAPCTVVVRHPSVLRHLVLHQDLVRLAESYLAGELDMRSAAYELAIRRVEQAISLRGF